MNNSWNVVENNSTKLVWKSLNDTNPEEIKEIEQNLNSEPFYCDTTSSVVFKTNKDFKVLKGINYSDLELESRYLKTDNKLYELLDQLNS